MTISLHPPDTARRNLTHHLVMGRAHLFVATVELEDAIATGVGLTSDNVEQVMAIQRSVAELTTRTLAYAAESAATPNDASGRSG